MCKLTMPAVFGLCLVSAMPMMARPDKADAEAETKTADAVRAVDDAWGRAELSGDVAFVDQVLLSDYRSVRPDGTVDNKTAILRGARMHPGDPGFANKMRDWRASHPERADVVIAGDTAVLTWILTTPGGGQPVLSCDVFAYVDGHWRAFYSQHTNATN